MESQATGRLVYFGITTARGKLFDTSIPLPEWAINGEPDRTGDIRHLDTPFIYYGKAEQQGDLIVDPTPTPTVFTAEPWQVLQDGAKHTKIVGFQGEYGKLPFQPHTSSAKRLAELAGVADIHELAETANLLAVPQGLNDFYEGIYTAREKLNALARTLTTLLGESRCCQFIICGRLVRDALLRCIKTHTLRGPVTSMLTRAGLYSGTMEPFKFYLIFHPISLRILLVAYIPDPSDLCREWNDPATFNWGCGFMRYALDPRHHELEKRGDEHECN